MEQLWFGWLNRLSGESLLSFAQAFHAEPVQTDGIAILAMSPAALIVTAGMCCLFGLLTLSPLLVDPNRPAGDE